MGDLSGMFRGTALRSYPSNVGGTLNLFGKISTSKVSLDTTTCVAFR